MTYKNPVSFRMDIGWRFLQFYIKRNQKMQETSICRPV